MPEAQQVASPEPVGAQGAPMDEADAVIDSMSAAIKASSGLATAISDAPEPVEEASALADGAPPPAPEPETAPWDPSKGFTAEELATPEGIQSAAAKIQGGLKEWRDKQVALDGRYAKFKEKEGRQRATFEKWQQEREQNALATRQIFDTVQAIRSGNAEMRLRALGTLMNMDPLAAIEEINLGIATDGKGRQRTPEEIEAEVERRLEAKMEAKLSERVKRAEYERSVEAFTHRAVAFAERIETGKYPLLGKFHALNPEAVLKDLLETSREGVDHDAFLAETEQRLAAHFGVPVSTGNGTQHPQTAQRSPAESLSPSLQSHGGSSRAKSDAELEAEAEALVPESWVRMGRGM